MVKKPKAINSLQDVGTGVVYGNPNMEGAKEFIHALILNKPIWPNLYGQDVAAAAFFIHEERLKYQEEISRLREEITNFPIQ